MRGIAVVLLVALGFVLSCHDAPAQGTCPPEWVSVSGLRGVNGAVRAVTRWDPDGAGPLGSVLVVGGTFTTAGLIAANSVAVWNPETREWSSLGTGITGSVRSLATLPSGELVVGGRFDSAGGVQASNIAKWNGSAWSRLGVGLDNSVLSLAVLPGGHLIAGGDFQNAGATYVNHVARWNGTAWSAVGAGLSGTVNALAVLAGGDVVAGGSFTNSGGVGLGQIARWDGSLWMPMGNGMNNSVFALAVSPSGDLIAGGRFSMAGAVSAGRVARWNGAAWSTFGVGVSSGDVNALAVTTNGDVVVGGTFMNAGGMAAQRIARWDGSLWRTLRQGLSGVGLLDVQALAATPDGGMVAGGSFTLAGDVSVRNIAAWDGGNWSSFGGGLDGSLYGAVELPDGDLVVCGFPRMADNVVVNGIARLHGDTWQSIGGLTSGDGSWGFGLCMLELPVGDVIVGGDFQSAGGVPARNIARWDGEAWHPLGTGTQGEVFADVFAVCSLSNGDIVAGGFFTSAGGTPASRIARWDGKQWHPLGAGLNGLVFALATLPNGDLIAGGQFTMAGGTPANRIARWNGSQWFPLGPGTSGPTADVLALAALPDGTLAVGGYFTHAGGVLVNRIARWNLATGAWSPFGAGTGMNGEVMTLAVLPGGELVAGGNFTTADGNAALFAARWTDSPFPGTWLPLGSGTDSFVRSITPLRDGSLAVAGNFLNAGGAASVYLARYVSEAASPSVVTQPEDDRTCPANAGVFSVKAAPASPSLAFEWQIQDPAGGPPPGAWITLGTAPVSLPGGGSASSNPADAPSVLIRVTGRLASFGVRCVVSNSCGSATSDAATLTLCAADFTCNGLVDSQDFFDFMSAFFGVAPAADFNADGVVDSQDYFDFIAALVTGC